MLEAGCCRAGAVTPVHIATLLAAPLSVCSSPAMTLKLTSHEYRREKAAVNHLGSDLAPAAVLLQLVATQQAKWYHTENTEHTWNTCHP